MIGTSRKLEDKCCCNNKQSYTEYAVYDCFFAPFESRNASVKKMYNGSTYSTTPNSPNINFAKKFPTTPHQPKLLIKKNVQTARQINRWISFFRACSCASCAFVFLPPVREADACLDDCEDLAFCGDLAVDVERLAVVLLLVFDCEPLLYVLLFPVATVCTPSLFPHSPIMTDIFLNVITHMAVRIHIQTATRVYLCQFKCSYCSILLFSLHLSSHINNSLRYGCRPPGR